MVKKLHRRALILSYLTVGYNVFEGLASLIFGSIAGSIALISFGLDSFVESLSGMIMIWRFRIHEKVSEEEEEKVESRARRFVGVTFFVFAVYVFYQSLNKLYFKEIPDVSLPGIIIAILSLITMPALFFFKSKTAVSIGSRSLAADARQTLACVFLSASLLLGLLLNYLWGLWQADPAIGFLIGFYLIKEGRETLFEVEEEDEDEKSLFNSE